MKASRHIAASNAVRASGLILSLAMLSFGVLLVLWPCPDIFAEAPELCAELLGARIDQLGALLVAMGGAGSAGWIGASWTSAASAKRHEGAREPSSDSIDLEPGATTPDDHEAP